MPVEMEEIEGDDLHVTNDKIALIDADSVIWAACSSNNETIELLPEHMYSDDELAEILADPFFVKDLWAIGHFDMDAAIKHAEDKLGRILLATGCSSYELHFTGGRKSFRYTEVDPMYKANRLPENQAKQDMPTLGIDDLKMHFVNMGQGEIHYEFEADDIVVTKKRMEPEKYIMCALDKDVIWSVPGTHFNFYESNQYNIPMKWVDVTVEVATKHHYLQTLTGDKGDNVMGIHGIGPKKAEKILADASNPMEMWTCVVDAYEKNKLTVVDAIMNMRLVNMHQLVLRDGKYVVELWKPPV